MPHGWGAASPHVSMFSNSARRHESARRGGGSRGCVSRGLGQARERRGSVLEDPAHRLVRRQNRQHLSAPLLHGCAQAFASGHRDLLERARRHRAGTAKRNRAATPTRNGRDAEHTAGADDGAKRACPARHGDFRGYAAGGCDEDAPQSEAHSAPANRRRASRLLGRRRFADPAGRDRGARSTAGCGRFGHICRQAAPSFLPARLTAGRCRCARPQMPLRHSDDERLGRLVVNALAAFVPGRPHDKRRKQVG